MYAGAIDSHAIYFDGSDVGLGRNSVDAITLMDDGSILISVSAFDNLSGPGVVADDVLRFIPVSLGSTTAGSFEIYRGGHATGI